jgi:hypothetical protein
LDVVKRCPYHSNVISSHCVNCGQHVPYACVNKQEAFSCGSCNSPLLAPDLNSLCSNHGERMRVAATHERLSRKIMAAPDLLSFGKGYYKARSLQSDVVGHVMEDLIDGGSTGRSLPLTVSAPHVAVKIVRNEQGRPCLKRITEIPLEARPDQSLIDVSSEIELAQLRVGAWALRHFSAHIACICAGRVEVKAPEALRPFSWVRTSPYACSIGMAFAAWEASRSDRATDGPSLSMWGSLNLDDRSHRMFAFYILEKACLVGAILPFINNDHHSLREWQRNGFALKLSGLDYVEWNVDSSCNLHFRGRNVQMDWLEKVIGELHCPSGQIGGSVAAKDLMRDLSSRYGTESRIAIGSKWMNEEINRRVRHVIRSAND